jgi:hypothetical protein
VRNNEAYYKKKYLIFSTSPAQCCYSFPCTNNTVKWLD